MLIIFVNKFMKKVFIVFILRNFCQENGRTHLALYFENEGIFISKISQIGSIPCQVYFIRAQTFLFCKVFATKTE